MNNSLHNYISLIHITPMFDNETDELWLDGYDDDNNHVFTIPGWTINRNSTEDEIKEAFTSWSRNVSDILTIEWEE